MIKEKEIRIEVKSRRYVNYYNELGYNIKLNDKLTVKVEDLPKGSHIIITGICDGCGKEKKMMYKTYNYSVGDTYCCRKCSKEKKNNTMLERYGHEHALQCDQFRDKKKLTWIENYGVDHPAKSKVVKDKFNKTMIGKYGVKNALENEKILNVMLDKQREENDGLLFVQTDKFKEKYKETCLKKYGVEYYLQTEDKKEKSRITCLKKYGVEYSTQCKEIFNKILKSGRKRLQYKDTELYYQGSYEKDFLELCESLNILDKVDRCFTIKYELNESELIYFPDFYIEELNLIVEIKSSYWYNKHKERNIAKEKQCKDSGYNYILIMNKDYKEFIKLITNWFYV